MLATLAHAASVAVAHLAQLIAFIPGDLLPPPVG
jgi:hypothetical protein